MATGTSQDANKETLLKFLDALYQEIRVLEEAHQLTVGKRDIRPAIEGYQDAIRVWAAGDSDAELSVGQVSHDLANIRKRAGWLASGPHVLWEWHYADFEAEMKARRAFKHWCIRNYRQLDIPLAVTQADLLAFGRYYQPARATGDRWRDSDRLEPLIKALRYREAQKFVPNRNGNGGRWQLIPAEEFWNSFEYTAGFFKELALEFSGEGHILLEDQRARKKGALTKAGAKAMLRTGEEAMRSLWIQIQHPVALRAAFVEARGLFGLNLFQKEADPHYAFDKKRAVAESDWQEMTADLRVLSEAYQRYAVLYAAALKDTVEEHYSENRDWLDALVGDSYRLMKTVERMEAGEKMLELHQIERLVQEVENPELKARLEKVLAARRISTNSGGDASFRSEVEAIMQQAEQEVEALEQAHFTFLSSQLAVYEQSKDVVKELASRGLNLAGKFVEAATAVSTGRGKGGKGR